MSIPGSQVQRSVAESVGGVLTRDFMEGWWAVSGSILCVGRIGLWLSGSCKECRELSVLFISSIQSINLSPPPLTLCVFQCGESCLTVEPHG